MCVTFEEKVCQRLEILTLSCHRSYYSIVYVIMNTNNKHKIHYTLHNFRSADDLAKRKNTSRHIFHIVSEKNTAPLDPK